MTDIFHRLPQEIMTCYGQGQSCLREAKAKNTENKGELGNPSQEQTL